MMMNSFLNGIQCWAVTPLVGTPQCYKNALNSTNCLRKVMFYLSKQYSFWASFVNL